MKGGEKAVGIRINKKLGWALEGLEHSENGQLTDPRVALSSSFLMPPEEVGPEYLAYLEALRDAEHEESEEWFELTMTVETVKEATRRDGSLPWPVTRKSDAGRRDVLLVQPVGFPRWSRYDDPIDYADEAALRPGITPRLEPMPYGIFPFEGLYMDSRDGRRLDSTAKRLIDKLLIREEGADEVRPERLKAADHLAGALGFEGSAQAQEYIAPVVPPDIRHVCSWLNLFNGPDVWLQLRPVLYVYWS